MVCQEAGNKAAWVRFTGIRDLSKQIEECSLYRSHSRFIIPTQHRNIFHEGGSILTSAFRLVAKATALAFIMGSGIGYSYAQQVMQNSWQLMYAPDGSRMAGFCVTGNANQREPFFSRCFGLICRDGNIFMAQVLSHHRRYTNGDKILKTVWIDGNFFNDWRFVERLDRNLQMNVSRDPVEKSILQELKRGRVYSEGLLTREMNNTLYGSANAIEGLQHLCGKYE